VSDQGGTRPSRSGVGRIYDSIIGWVCGRPRLYPWHFQWLAVSALYEDLRRVLPTLRGLVLDVGCGDKPYAQWLTSAQEHVGLDVYAGPEVDVVVDGQGAWPLAAESFDAVLCTQVLEHVTDLDHVLGEVRRVLRSNGLLIVSAPFAYNEHGAPHDYRRFSVRGLEQLFRRDYEILETRTEGGIASTCFVLAFNWLDAATDLSRPTRILKAISLPLWVPVCAMLNLVGWLLDKLDYTGAFYGNCFLVARKTTRGGAGAT
jgi:SAM-dependent methyltransferase